ERRLLRRSRAPCGRARNGHEGSSRRTIRRSRRRPRCWFHGVNCHSLTAAAAAELGRSAIGRKGDVLLFRENRMSPFLFLFCFLSWLQHFGLLQSRLRCLTFRKPALVQRGTSSVLSVLSFPQGVAP